MKDTLDLNILFLRMELNEVTKMLKMIDVTPLVYCHVA